MPTGKGFWPGHNFQQVCRRYSWLILIKLIENWIRELLLGWGAAEELTFFILQALGSVLVIILCFVIVIALIWVERKLAGRIQDRFGPNRAGPYGIFQSFADIIKIFTKEYITPEGAEKGLFNIAPVLAMASVLAIWAVFPICCEFDWRRRSRRRIVYSGSGSFWHPGDLDGGLVIQ